MKSKTKTQPKTNTRLETEKCFQEVISAAREFEGLKKINKNTKLTYLQLIKNAHVAGLKSMINEVLEDLHAKKISKKDAGEAIKSLSEDIIAAEKSTSNAVKDVDNQP